MRDHAAALQAVRVQVPTTKKDLFCSSVPIHLGLNRIVGEKGPAILGLYSPSDLPSARAVFLLATSALFKPKVHCEVSLIARLQVCRSRFWALKTRLRGLDGRWQSFRRLFFVSFEEG